MLKRLFILNTDDSRPWIKIILWWEFRRILFNFLLIVFGIFALTILSFIVKDLWSFFSPPIFFLMWTGLFLIFANVFYTSGWIFQLITRTPTTNLKISSKHDNTTKALLLAKPLFMIKLNEFISLRTSHLLPLKSLW
jgi:hypothetical protein